MITPMTSLLLSTLLLALPIQTTHAYFNPDGGQEYYSKLIIQQSRLEVRIQRRPALVKNPRVVVEHSTREQTQQQGVLRTRWNGDPREDCIRILGSMNSRRLSDCIEIQRDGGVFGTGPFDTN